MAEWLSEAALQEALRSQFVRLSRELREDVCRELQRLAQDIRTSGGGLDLDGGSPTNIAWRPVYLRRDYSKEYPGAFASEEDRLSSPTSRELGSAQPPHTGRLLGTDECGNLPRVGDAGFQEERGDGDSDPRDLDLGQVSVNPDTPGGVGGQSRTSSRRIKIQKAEHAMGFWTPKGQQWSKAAPAGGGQGTGTRWTANTLVNSATYEMFTLALIVVSALQVGLQTDYMARYRLDQVPLAHRVAGVVLCCLFALELGLRFYVHRSRFFRMWGWAWNVFDVVLVVLQITEEVLVAVEVGGDHTNHVGSSILLRVVRVLRVIRVMRILRVMQFTEELQLLVSCILHSMQAFMWAAILVFLLVYIMSVYLTQVVLVWRLDTEADTDGHLVKFFGNVPIAALSLFQALTGGVDWNDMVAPLISSISPLLGVVMVIYILFSLFVVMNLVTSIFVQVAIDRAVEVKDVRHLDRAYRIFATLDLDRNGTVSMEDLGRHLESKAVKDYFSDIGVNTSDAVLLFNLLDVNHNGVIDFEEFLSGCIRLRGPAKAIDLLLATRDTRYTVEQLQCRLLAVEARFRIPDEPTSGGPRIAAT